MRRSHLKATTGPLRSPRLLIIISFMAELTTAKWIRRILEGAWLFQGLCTCFPFQSVYAL